MQKENRILSNKLFLLEVLDNQCEGYLLVKGFKVLSKMFIEVIETY